VISLTGQRDEIEAFLAAWTAAERKGDTTALDGLLTGDFVGVGPLGFTLSKQEWLARHATGDLKYETFQLDELQERVYGDAAAITARQVGRGAYRGGPVPEVLRATLVVARQSGDWRLAGIHYSFIAGTPGAPPLPGPPPAPATGPRG
jgi:ketosteroid isomerase-like protein